MPKNSIFEIAIDVSPEKITATLLPDGKTISLQNFVLIDQTTKHIVATGRSRDEFENMFSFKLYSFELIVYSSAKVSILSIMILNLSSRYFLQQP